MTSVTPAQKLYFAAVGLLALWVGVWGYFIPGQVDRAIPWLVPPLHARFLGSMYLSGATFMLGSILAHRYSEVRVVVPSIAIWTGMLFIVSLFYLGEFNYSRIQVWIWFGAYLIYPLIALWLAWRHRQIDHDTASGAALPAWVKGYLRVQGLMVTGLALALLLLPELMVTVWPWKITRMLAQMYAAPFLSYGLNSLMLSRRHTWSEIRVSVIATGVFALGVLLASLIHINVLLPLGMAGGLWLGGFGVATLMLALLSVQVLRTRSAA